MGHSRRLVPAVLLLFLLLVSSEMGMNTVEGRTCETLSEKFKGPCVSDRNCANVCRGEGGGFDGGVCKGFRRRCFCTRPCRDS